MKINKQKILGLIFSLLLSCFPAFPQNKSADLVIINAKVRTMDKAKPQAEALAVSGNIISAVGMNREIRALVGAKTKIIDAGGKLVLPGFNDAHVHFTGIGNQFSSIDLRDAKSPQEAVELIKFFTKFLPKGRWILGGRWNHENWTPAALPSKELLDAVTPDHPVFIYHLNARTALANSLALKLAGVDNNRKSTIDGFERDRKGEPTGILRDSAIAVVKNITPQLHSKNWSEIIETASNYAASLGVTSVQDVHSDTLVEIYRELFRQGKLKTRIYDCSPLSDWKKLADARVRRASGDPMIRSGCLKHFSDGYYDEIPELLRDILAADKADLQVMMHAIGGNANDIILTVFERVATENGAAKDRRFRVEHAHNFRSEDLRRFGASKTIASMQPHLFFGGEPYRALFNSGALLAFGSDASITDFNPLYGVHAAVTRGNQTISVEEAVRAYTVGSAYAEFQENIKGSISVGKLADLIILSDDIFTIKPNDIQKVRVMMTMVDGRIVFEGK
jgi:predicted amidohydrolase YtcJ